MNRRSFLKCGQALPLVLIPVTTFKTIEDANAAPLVDLPGQPQLYKELIYKLKLTTKLNVDDNFPLGSPGVIFKALHGKVGEVHRGGTAFEVRMGNFMMGKFNPEEFLGLDSSIRDLVVDKMVTYISNKAAKLGKTDLYMWPGSIATEPDFDLENGPRDYIVIAVIFGLA